MGNVIDVDNTYHLAKAVWRLLAELQLTIEKADAAQELLEYPIGNEYSTIEGATACMIPDCTACEKLKELEGKARSEGVLL